MAFEMDQKKKILIGVIVLLAVVLGAGLYLTQAQETAELTALRKQVGESEAEYIERRVRQHNTENNIDMSEEDLKIRLEKLKGTHLY